MGNSIRQAGMADLDALAALEAASFVCDGVTRRAMAGFLRSAAALVLLDAGAGPLEGSLHGPPRGRLRGQLRGQLRGHLVLRFNQRHRIARIYSIAVAADSQGQGVGRRLVAAAEQAARARGRTRMRLEISVDNAASQALFRACGYTVFGHYEDYYEDGGDALRLEKTLG